MSDITAFPDTPEGWQAKWKAEMDYAKEKIKKWHISGDEVRKAFLDIKDDATKTRLNLFHANIVTLKSMLYGRIPKVDVDRRDLDPNDDVGRVASEISSRLLNLDIEEPGDDFSQVMRNALEDRLLPGMGQCRLKYDFESETHTVPAITHPETGMVQAPAYEEEGIKDEWIDTLYVHWKDFMWSPCRTWGENRWVAFREFLDKDAATERFGKEIADALTYSSKSPLDTQSKATTITKEVWAKQEIWEIWDKTTKKVFWWTSGYAKILDVKDDPLKLCSFWPCPPPMAANTTTEEFMPKADFVLSQDLYKQIDKLQERIESLTTACKVVGLYDKTAKGSIGQMLKPGTENQMLPIDNWAMFAEKGGIKGVVEFLPLEQVIITIEKLEQLQQAKIEQLYQVSGMSDILRGVSSGDTATGDALKAKFASVRIQALQDEFSRFASDIQKIKFEMIGKVYSPETIIKASNILSSMDGQDANLIQQAVQLIKDESASKWRIQIRPENMAMVDYTQIRQERTEYMNAMGLYMQSAKPLIEQNPNIAPFLLEMMKWGLAGFKGSNQIEGIVDHFIDQVKKDLAAKAANPQQGQNPEMMKAQADMQHLQMKHQQDMEKIQAQTQAKMSEMVAEFQIQNKQMQDSLQGDLVRQHTQLRGDLIQALTDHQLQSAHLRAQNEAKKGVPNA